MSDDKTNDDIVRVDPSMDGITHINAHSQSKKKLHRILSPSYDTGESINHPILGPFRSVENMWCYLNTGGNIDRIRTMEPHVARNFMSLAPKYKCNKFREAIIDGTLLKLQKNSDWLLMVAQSTLPFEYYFLKGIDKLPIHPAVSGLYIEILNEVREIVRGNKEHEFVRFRDMKFEKIEEGVKRKRKKKGVDEND